MKELVRLHGLEQNHKGPENALIERMPPATAVGPIDSSASVDDSTTTALIGPVVNS
jgi:hypothetical protein